MKLTAYQQYIDSGVDWLGEIPDHWRSVSLKWISRRYAGGTPDKSIQDYWEDGTIPWLNSGAVNDFFIEEPSTYITEEAYRNSSAKWIAKGNLVIALAGQGKTKGMVAQLGIDTTCNQSMAAICPRNDINKRFLLWWLTRNYINIRNLAGGDQRDGLNLVMIGHITVPLIPPGEQKSIADFLDRETGIIAELISKKEILIERLKEKRTALISRAVTKGLKPYVRLKPSGVEWLGDVPEHWDIKRIRYCILRNDGGVWGEEPLNDGTDTVVLRSTEQTVDGFWNIVDPALRSLTKLEKVKALLKEGDLVITKSSGSELHIGKTTLVGKDIEKEKCCFSNFMQRIQVTRNTFPKYLWYIFNNFIARDQFVYYSNSTTGLANLNPSLIGQVSVAYPPLLEQQAIAEYLDCETGEIDALSEKVQMAIEKLKEYRTAIISAAVTGKIDVREGVA